MDPISIHEAGHAVVLMREMGRAPLQLVHDPKTGKAFANAGIGMPSSGHDATRFAAYFFGGAAAVSHGKQVGDLPPHTNPMIGFDGPPGSGCDSDLIRRLGEHGADLVAARAMAQAAVRDFWPEIVSIAQALDAKGALAQPALLALLSGVPHRL